MKKFLCGLLVGILLMVSVPAFGAVGQQITVAINSIKAIVNGQEMTADRFVYKDRTYVQLKELTDMLGGELQWDKENNAAIAIIDLNKPEEVNPLPLKDIEESKPATEPQPEPTTRETPPTQNQEPQQDSGGGEQPEEPDEPEPPEEPEPPNTGAYEAELAALTAAYEADINALDRERYNELNKAITDYEISVYNLIQRGVNAKIEQIRINSITQGIDGKYQQKKDARTARYNSDVAALQAKYGL